jgi:hypothetical protein
MVTNRGRKQVQTVNVPDTIGRRLVAFIFEEAKLARLKALAKTFPKAAVASYVESSTHLTLLQFAVITGNVWAGLSTLLHTLLCLYPSDLSPFSLQIGSLTLVHCQQRTTFYPSELIGMSTTLAVGISRTMAGCPCQQ